MSDALYIKALEATVTQLRGNNERLKKAIKAVSDLIDSSTGVCGLHQNGDVAPWDELLAGGQYEHWLADLSEALEAKP